MEEKIDYMKKLNDIDKRVSVIESEKRRMKGSVDPRFVIILFLLILLFMYLRTTGIL